MFLGNSFLDKSHGSMKLRTSTKLRMATFPVALVLVIALAVSVRAEDKTIHLKLPKRTHPTPVQQLNRDGVKAIDNHQYDKARKIFYKAYLLDPNDPFTLNNLGYISELEGDVDRAQRYYDLAQQQTSDANVDLASATDLEGKPVSKVAGNAAETGMQINRMNVAAISLLSKDRAPEADLVLQKALKLDPHNPFTLNNMGYTKEKEGELESALSFYTSAASLHSREPVIVTIDKDWRGKPISEIADRNANKLRKLMAAEQTPSARVARLNLQGVSAMNRNDRRNARQFFEQAYKLDPNDAFTLNNMGYIAEMDGDRETANFYYEKSREAKRNKDRVTIATRREAEGRSVAAVADNSNAKVEAKMEQQREQKRRQGGPIELRHRDGTPATDAVPPPDNTPPSNTQTRGSLVQQPAESSDEPVPPTNAQPADNQQMQPVPQISPNMQTPAGQPQNSQTPNSHASVPPPQ